MFQNALGSITKAIPLLNAFSSAAPAGKPQSGMGGIVDQFVPPVAKSLIGAVTQGLQSGGSLHSGLRAPVNILKSVVSGQPMDATAKANIQSALDEVKAGKPLHECLSHLSEQEKTLLADTIGNSGFEPPEALTPYLTNKSQGDASRMDCALKNVEVAEEHGYEATEASTIFRLLPLGLLLGV